MPFAMSAARRRARGLCWEGGGLLSSYAYLRMVERERERETNDSETHMYGRRQSQTHRHTILQRVVILGKYKREMSPIARTKHYTSFIRLMRPVMTQVNTYKSWKEPSSHSSSTNTKSSSVSANPINSTTFGCRRRAIVLHSSRNAFCTFR